MRWIFILYAGVFGLEYLPDIRCFKVESAEQENMECWVDAKDFIVADVIRWKEGVFDTRRRGRTPPIGERLIAAEVLQREGDAWARLLVRACSITRKNAAGRTVPTIKSGEVIRRARRTLLRGKVERLLWDNESARAAVVASKPVKSRFVKAEDEA